jgi:hypothetical protein
MPRPLLTNASFLGFLFSPAKHPKPVGLRKQSVTGLRGGRTKARVNAFNRMSAANQQLLKMAGLRDDYLRGNASLRDAKELLRPQAIGMNLARPSRTPQPAPRVPVVLSRRQQLDQMIARHIKVTVSHAGKKFNGPAVDQRVRRIPEFIASQVVTWDYDTIRDAASNGSPFDVIEDNVRFNPFWYN